MPRSVRLFAAPVLAQVPLNLAGGAYTDRIGGRRIMLGSCWAAVVAGVWLMFAHRFWMLMPGQLALVLSRAAFWPATWALASELPGSAASSWDASTQRPTLARSPALRCADFSSPQWDSSPLSSPWRALG